MDFLTIALARKGLASLDNQNQVVEEQLPSFVNDVLEFNTKSDFPSEGETGKIYLATNTNLIYHYNEQEEGYIQIAADKQSSILIFYNNPTNLQKEKNLGIFESISSLNLDQYELFIQVDDSYAMASYYKLNDGTHVAKAIIPNKEDNNFKIFTIKGKTVSSYEQSSIDFISTMTTDFDTGWIPLELVTGAIVTECGNLYTQNVPMANSLAYRVVNGNHVYITGGFTLTDYDDSIITISEALPSNLMPTQKIYDSVESDWSVDNEGIVISQNYNKRVFCITDDITTQIAIELDSANCVLKLIGTTNSDTVNYVQIAFDYFID